MALPTQAFLASLIPSQTSGTINPVALTRRISAAIPTASVSISGTTVTVIISGTELTASLAGTATFGQVAITVPSISDANASKTQTGKAPT
ncbi:MAG: hypothetical protein ABF812_12680 [Gluconobacter cerinus]|uniref:hypothetical protein n=1 Tax=Gluconobacter cerinus TaxID=38307 RepID=UPI0039ED8438